MSKELLRSLKEALIGTSMIDSKKFFLLTGQVPESVTITMIKEEKNVRPKKKR